MKQILIALAIFALAASLPAQQNGPAPSTRQSGKDLARLHAAASDLAAYRACLAKGDLKSAKIIMEERLVPGSPVSQQLEAAMLCYEMKEYRQAAAHLDLFEKGHAAADETPAAAARITACSILIRAGAAGRSPDWSSLKSGDPKTTPGQVLVTEVQRLAAEYHFRTAQILLNELPKLKVEKWVIDGLAQEIQRKKVEQMAAVKAP